MWTRRARVRPRTIRTVPWTPVHAGAPPRKGPSISDPPFTAKSGAEGPEVGPYALEGPQTLRLGSRAGGVPDQELCLCPPGEQRAGGGWTVPPALSQCQHHTHPRQAELRRNQPPSRVRVWPQASQGDVTLPGRKRSQGPRTDWACCPKHRSTEAPSRTHRLLSKAQNRSSAAGR